MKFEKFIAHRGANTYAPENTLEAFERAVEYGVNWIELDVQMTTDQELILFHDHQTERMSLEKRVITEMSYQDVKSLDVAAGFPGFFGSCSIPTLREYLEWMGKYPNVHTNVEIKVKPYQDEKYEIALAKRVVELLAEYPDLKSRLLLSSFSSSVMKALSEHNQSIDKPYALEMLVWFPEERDWEECLTEFRSDYYECFEEWKCVALGINGEGLTEQRVEELKSLCGNILCYSNSTFSELDVSRLLNWGVDAVFIDEMKHAETALSHAKRPIKIGFLATGDEITTGDIQNTNTPKLASELYAKGYKIGMHLACYDSQRKIEKSLSYLLSEHDVVITVGGLGPTEDDKTRQAIAYVAGKSLRFSDESWQRITDRILKRFKEVPENNRQQAYFPDDAKILPNSRGTADGCIVHLPDDKKVIMLPGPPSECFGMFHDQIVPFFDELGGKIERVTKSWQLLGASEADISQRLKPIANKYSESLGYRAAYPYLEIKLHSTTRLSDLEPLVDEIERLVKPYLASATKQLASETLLELIERHHVSLKLKKDVTKGHLFSRFATLNTQLHPRYLLELNTHGLEQFWRGEASISDHFEVEIKVTDCQQKRALECQMDTQIFIKGPDSLNYVYEWVCWKMKELLEKEVEHV